MGKVTIFTLDGCPTCNKTKQLLETRGAELTEVSLTTTPEWVPLLFVLANGNTMYVMYVCFSMHARILIPLIDGMHAFADCMFS